MNIVTVGDGLGWSCDALISLAHTIRGTAGRADKTFGKLEGLARHLSQCRERRPEHNTTVLVKPCSLPAMFPSLEAQRTAVCTVLAGIVGAVEREMIVARQDPAIERPRDRSSDESFEWGVHESPFITAVNEALYQLTDLDIPAPVVKGPRAPRK
jgi:hypothetical protein